MTRHPTDCQPVSSLPLSATRLARRYPGGVPTEKLPKSFNAAIKLMVDYALLGDRMARARELAAAQLKDELGMSSEDISQLFKRALEERPELSTRHLEQIGVSRATINHAIRAHRIRSGEA